MREILFRGKREDNGQWVIGFPSKTRGLDNKLHICIDYEEKGLMCSSIVVPTTIGQYTGLTDKNGKKIFEGDIVKYKNTDGIKVNGVALTIIGKVNYNEKNASFAIDGKDKIGAKHYDYFPIKNIEVIGNIQDNPELLKEAEQK